MNRIDASSYLTLPGLASILFLGFSTPHGWAQTPPGAGQLLDQMRTPLPAAAPAASALPTVTPPALTTDLQGLRVRVTAVSVTGAQAYASSELQALVADLLGTERSLADLQRAAARITQHYREQGYLLARAYLPEQDLGDGRVEIRVLEGRLGAVRLDNSSTQPDTFVQQRLQALVPGQALQAPSLERGLLLLADTPGLAVRSSLRPGASVGTSDLDIVVREGARVSGDVSMDNQGSRASGRERVGGGVTFNNPLGLGDALQLRGLTSGRGLNFARVAYQLPVGAAGTRLGASYSALNYKLGEDFAALDAHGTARIASVFLTHPFIRSRMVNLSGQLALEQKELDDRIDLTDTVSQRRLDNLTFGLSGDRADMAGGGATQGSLSLTLGTLSLDASSAALDAQGLRSQGGYAKVNMWLRRVQALYPGLQLHAQWSAQLAGDNLDSAEKMTLGGANGVRAYPQGEAASDDAWLANLELRYSVAAGGQALLFYDAAHGRLSHAPLASTSANRRTLSGTGVGVRWNHAEGYSLLTTLAWRTSGSPTAEPDRRPRLWLQLGKSF